MAAQVKIDLKNIGTLFALVRKAEQWQHSTTNGNLAGIRMNCSNFIRRIHDQAYRRVSCRKKFESLKLIMELRRVLSVIALPLKHKHYNCALVQLFLTRSQIIRSIHHRQMPRLLD